MTTSTAASPTIDRRRFRRTVRFFAGVILNIVVYDLLLTRLFFMRGWVRRRRPDRYRHHARRFRELATSMGGVMIKLGQFLSARVDVLPPEITEELRGLQDEVPPVAFSAIEAVARADLGDLERHFSLIESEPMAAASLGQTHRAWLRDPNGRQRPDAAVVIKVQRPQIEELVMTDLEALRVVARWVMRYRPISRRANVPALMEEFAHTLWEELDYRTEAQNASRFRAIFARDTQVRIPRFYETYCTARVLVMENVESIKITDVTAMRAAGIDPKAVAAKLLDVYFKQIFEEAFFHADPHPGNLFVQPRDTLLRAGEGGSRPFQLTFIDFGMVGRAEALRGRLSKLLIAVTQRDARALTEAYDELGFFLPGADLERIAEAQERILNQIWGRQLLELARPDPREVQELGLEFRDILFEFPFQVPQDFIYLGRALGILSGLVSLLDPQINPWFYLEQYGERLITTQEGRAFSREALVGVVRPYLALPSMLRRFLESAEEGRLPTSIRQDRRLEQRLDALDNRLARLNWTIIAAVAGLGGVLFYLNGNPWLSATGWIIAGVTLLWGWFRYA